MRKMHRNILDVDKKIHTFISFVRVEAMKFLLIDICAEIHEACRFINKQNNF